MQVLSGFVTPIVLAFILILANRRSVLDDAVNGPRLNVVATISVIAVAILAAVVFVQTVGGWVGLL
jgi:Mn2+/Fe2+ NRAMP family transporter